MKSKLTSIEKLNALTDSVAIDIMAMSDEEILDIATGVFGSKDEINKVFDNVVEKAIVDVGRKRFQAAKAKLDEENRHHKKSKINSLSLEQKQKVIEMIQRNSDIPTLAARNASKIQDDLDSLLEDLVQVGIIDEDGNLL